MDHSVLAAMPAFQGRTWGRATGISHSGLAHSEPANVEALTCIGLAAEYNFRRLTTYRERERHGDSIRIRATESAAFFRFDKLAYFNSVYTCDETIVDRLSEVEEFYADCPFACSLVGPPLKQPARYAEACRQRNWHPHGSYAWMHGALSAMGAMPEASAYGPFDIRSPHPDERELFLHCYLESFASPPQGRADAVRNMRHLFEWPDLHCLFAFRDGKPIGIAMLLQVEEAALYCAGGVLPQFEKQGCHAALLAARTRLARKLGCREAFSWADADSQSQRNMMQAGFSVAGVTQTWSFSSHL